MDTRKPSPLLHRAGYSFLLGFGIFLAGALLEVLLRQKGVTGRWELVDNCVTAVITGFLVFAYEKQRYKTLLRNLRVIAAMNHHVRNALQSVMKLPYSSTQGEQIMLARESVNRIQWALQEVLPGESEQAQELPGEKQDDSLKP